MFSQFFNYLSTHIYLFFGADVNNPKHNFLHAAARVGNVGTLEYLIKKKGADINLLNLDGLPPIHYAIKNAQFDSLKLFISMNADVAFIDSKTGDTLLHVAASEIATNCKLCEIAIRKELFDAAKNLINVQNKSMQTPLTIALNRGDVLLSKYIKNDLNAKFDPILEGIDILAKRVKELDVETVKTLVHEFAVPVNSIDSKGIPIICNGIQSKAMTDLLISFGANVNLMLENGRSLLHNTIVNGSEGAALSMLSFGANPNTLDHFGKSPLYDAFRKGYDILAQNILGMNHYYIGFDILSSNIVFEMIDDSKVKALELLLKVLPSQLNLVSEGQSPLLRALKTSELKVAKLLKDYGATFNSYDPAVIDVVHSSIKSNKAEVIKFLVKEFGLNLTGVAINGKNVLVESLKNYKSKEFYNLVKVLLESGVKADSIDLNTGKTSLQIAVEQNDIKLVEMLLSYGANPNVIDLNYKTPLVYAVNNDFNTIASMLIAHGANTETRDVVSTMTPVQIAVVRDNFKMLKELAIKGGANLDAKVLSNSQNVLHLAAKHANSDVLEFLLKYVPVHNLNLRDMNGDLPLDVAIKANRVTCESLLKKAMHIEDTHPLPEASPEYVETNNYNGKDKYAPSAPPLDDDNSDALYPDLFAPSAPPLDA